jgi:YkoY family integral membrane protein
MPFALPIVEAQDLIAIGFLVFLEGVLSIDNALVLALIVRPLPPALRKRALTYGIVGAIGFRLIAVLAAAWLMRWEWVKLVGGAYLVYLPVKYTLERRHKKGKEAAAAPARTFWTTVLVVELSDILFAVDSILTAVALSRKIWVVMIGGILGMIAMRVAAGIFLGLLERFPRFEPVAYVLVLIVGLKLLAEGVASQLGVAGLSFHDPHSLPFWVFWVAMALAFAYGFVPVRKKPLRHEP